MTHQLQTIYEKVVNGSPISDEEIEVGIKAFQQIASLTLHAGPVFKLASNEANRIACTLRGFQTARKADVLIRSFK